LVQHSTIAQLSVTQRFLDDLFLLSFVAQTLAFR
jgi:hypothetical protein